MRSTLRADRWLWFARLFKSRTLAAEACGSGRVRINGQLMRKPSHQLRSGDVLTFARGGDIRVVKVAALGAYRGPITKARTLYEDLSPPPARLQTQSQALAPQREPGTGRPTKSDRRAIQRLRDRY